MSHIAYFLERLDGHEVSGWLCTDIMAHTLLSYL